MSPVSLKLTSISKSYPGVRALDAVSLECAAGEIHAVLGENGSGKSTLLGIASGAVTPNSGTVEIMGVPLTTPDPLKARGLGLATVYQDDSLVRELTVAQNLFLGSVDPTITYGGMNAWAARQLATYDLHLPVDALAGDLTTADRQFLEIVKALTSKPKVLLLDEPTSTLDLDSVTKLSAIVRRLAADGTAIVYVSHRLPEILDLANRVTILRDGVGRGTYEIGKGLSEKDLVSLMVGRSIDTEYPAKGVGATEATALAVSHLRSRNVKDVSFALRRGEILGFAGAEGNGQRETIRALAGLAEATGSVSLEGRPVQFSTPREAIGSGLLFLSADRGFESIFPELGIRENLTLQVLDRFASGGLVSSPRERAEAQTLVRDYGIVTSSLDQPINGLSGGNQQKTVLARSFLYGAQVVLIDEPTQGVDAGARFDIYSSIRAKVATGTSCIVNSSDALELAGLCDRVLVFSRGRIIRELVGDEVTEPAIVSSFLLSRDTHETSAPPSKMSTLVRDFVAALSGGGGRWWMPLSFLAILTLAISAFAAAQSDVFLTPTNLRHILLATAPLALVAAAQFIVLLVRGFDMSVGSLMSLTVVVASYLIGAEIGPVAFVVGLAGCLLIGLAAGLFNGWMVRFAGVNPVITTIAMLSVFQGVALMLRSTPGGLINPDFTEFLKLQIGPLPASFFVLLVLAGVGDFWLHRTRSGLRVQAVGFREQAAKRNGVRVNFLQVRAYVLASLLSVVAGMFLSSEVGVGHPTIGATYTLTSIAAAVLGGAALTGGRGSFLGTLLAALFFTATINVISLLGFNTAVGIIVSGALTLFAVFLYSGLGPVRQIYQRVRRQMRRTAMADE
ncbi:MAG: ATP-binding cassette domain-containing protein [Devosia sp.]